VRPAGFDDPDIVMVYGGAGEPEGILYSDEGGAAAAAAAAADGDAPLLLRAGDGAVLGLVLAVLRDLEGSAELARVACVCRALRAAAGEAALWTAVRLGAGAAPVSDAALNAACARAAGGLASLDIAAGGPASGLRWFSLVRAVQARAPARPPTRPATAARPPARLTATRWPLCAAQSVARGAARAPPGPSPGHFPEPSMPFHTSSILYRN
jgi:hypothetical protein